MLIGEGYSLKRKCFRLALQIGSASGSAAFNFDGNTGQRLAGIVFYNARQDVIAVHLGKRNIR